MLAAFRSLKLKNELEELHSRDLWHVNRLHDVRLFSDVLNRVVLKQLLVARRNEHERNDSLVEDAVHERHHFVHCEFDLGRR